MKWDSDGLSLHTSRRTSQGFNSLHQPHTHHHTLVARLAQSFSRHRPSARRLRPSCALSSLLLPNQLAVSTDILTYYCTLETLTFKPSVCSFSSRRSPPQKKHDADRGQTSSLTFSSATCDLTPGFFIYLFFLSDFKTTSCITRGCSST